MQLAFIASDDSILPIIEAAQACEGVELAASWTLSEQLRTEIARKHNGLRFTNAWTDLLSNSGIDTIAIAGSDPEVVTAATHLLHSGRRLLVSTLSTDPASIFTYTALWQDSPDQIQPLFFSGVSQVVRQLATQLPNTETGPLWRVEFSRTMAVQNSKSLQQPRLSRSDISTQLFQDLSWFRPIEANSRQITMLVTEQGDAEFPIEAQVKLTGENAVELNWRLNAGDSNGWNMNLIGERGNHRIECAPDGKVTTLSETSLATPNAATIVGDLIEQLRSINNAEPHPSWYEVIQLGEIGAAAERSVQKKRTISIQYEDASERSQFKSQMTAIGCGALLWAMFGTITMLIVGASVDPRDREYITSASADYVLRHEDFTQNSNQLNQTGETHLREIARTWSSTSPVLILESDDQGHEDLDESRALTVLDELGLLDINDAKQRLAVRPLPGQAFETLLIIGWTVVFSPIAIVMIAQLLILVARPAE